ncbi:hypothetical protein BHE74_00037682 [Ensete ventricosum]|nr:hypothetical protein GW17_00039704 [Ensete ventricosum]RWW55663.1 hypothetical protein BHE74_00037682 [Ensete ventricosum]RZS10264.1 hypothetical protein BHM03_00041455 [Ensete ventricosum]
MVRYPGIERYDTPVLSGIFLPLLLLPPSTDTAKSAGDGQNRPLPLDSDWQRSKLTVTDQFRVVMGGNNRYLVVPPGSG